MTTPNGKDDIAASTYDFAGTMIAGLVRHYVPSSERLLDIGAGWGKYRWLLPEYEMDAVEAWAPNVVKCNLSDYYRNVHVCDIVSHNINDQYGGIIFGDVLEHLSVTQAKLVVYRAQQIAPLFVAVPFEMPQHEEEGNPYEAHLQDDLNVSIMRERYPMLALVSVSRHATGYMKAIYTTCEESR